MRVVLTLVFCALVKFGMAAKLSLWVRSVPPAALLVLAMMAAILLVRGPPLYGLGPVCYAATLLTLMCYEALFVRGLHLARVEEVMDETGAVSEVDAALCEIVNEAASVGAAAPGGLFGGFVLVGETVGVDLFPSAGVLVPDLKGNCCRACDHLSAGRVCSHLCEQTWNVEIARCDRVCLLLSAPFGCDACCMFLRSWPPFQSYE